jgi:uncharacterized protein (DUF305 family)
MRKSFVASSRCKYFVSTRSAAVRRKYTLYPTLPEGEEIVRRFQKTATKMTGFAVLILCAGRAHAAPFDQQFIDSMVPHHLMAVDMAKLALQKAQHPQLKRMARQIIADQQREIAQMRAWRKAWYPKAAAPVTGMNHGAMNHSMGGMSGSMNHQMPMSGSKMSMPTTMMGLSMKQEMDMGKLAQSKYFDRDFLRMMVPHHAGALLMAQEALNVTARPQLRKLSHQIIDSQAKEIGEMRALHRLWYGSM